LISDAKERGIEVSTGVVMFDDPSAQMSLAIRRRLILRTAAAGSQ
jgi:hypothetical protein